MPDFNNVSEMTGLFRTLFQTSKNEGNSRTFKTIINVTDAVGRYVYNAEGRAVSDLYWLTVYFLSEKLGYKDNIIVGVFDRLNPDFAVAMKMHRLFEPDKNQPTCWF